MADFFERELLTHVPDVWIDEGRRDRKDGEIGIIGWEITSVAVSRFRPPRPPEEIEADIRGIEKDILRLLRKVTGGEAPGV